VSEICVATIQSKIAIFCASYRTYNFFIGQVRHSIANTIASILQPGTTNDSLNFFDFESMIKSNSNKVHAKSEQSSVVPKSGTASVKSPSRHRSFALLGFRFAKFEINITKPKSENFDLKFRNLQL
jgi:hypothetical protein